MRVISGLHKGRRLLCPRGLDLRPTSGRVKEALFSIIGPRIVESTFLDLYAGTGAIGIEAFSRGARRVVFVESHPYSLRLLYANLAQCHCSTAVEVHACAIQNFFERRAADQAVFDIVFADPPYHSDDINELLSALDQSVMISTTTTVVLEHDTKYPIPSQNGRLSLVRHYRYGDNSLSKFIVLSQRSLLS